MTISLARGDTFVNGLAPLRARAFNWGEELTVVRRDTHGYECTRYLVSDRHGKHGYAY